MGGANTTGEAFGRSLLDARQAPPGVAAGALGDRSGGGSGVRGIYVGSRWEVERDRGKERGQGGGTGAIKMGYGGRVGTYGVPGQIPGGGGDLSGGAPDP